MLRTGRLHLVQFRQPITGAGSAKPRREEHLTMKHFVVEATYLAPLEEIQKVIPRHRAWLQRGYDLGLFLCSGPQTPPVGGFLVARAESVTDLTTMFAEEL